MISTKYTIREQNETNILNTIIQEKEISRAEISQLTGLNKASVSAISKKLLEDELILETRVGDASQSGGRKPIMLTFNQESALVLAIDVGYNYIEGMLAYIDGTIIKTIKRRRLSITADNVVKQLSLVADRFLRDPPPAPHGVVGMTIAIHGTVFENRITFTPYYDLDRIDLAEELSAKYPFPVYLINEANSAALGEYTFSSEYQQLVSISSHSGIGGGIVENGRLQVGQKGQAGEIGHTILYPDGKACPCGNLGCLEQYASNKVVYETLIAKKGWEYANSDNVAAAYYQNDPDAVALMEENAKLLSIGINNIIMLYEPNIIVINSSIYRKIPELVTVVAENLHSRFSQDIPIRNTFLEEHATLYGAVAFSAQQFLNIQKLKLRSVE